MDGARLAGVDGGGGAAGGRRDQTGADRMNKHPSAENLQDATPGDQVAPKTRKAGPQAAKRTCIMVLGMHRSGTSALTRAISLLGAELPKNLLGANPSNPAGHWEPERLIELHDQMLAEAGSSWDDWRAFDPSDLGAARLRFYKAEIARLIDKEYGSAPLFVLKEPRISRFVPLYADILERMRIDVRYVLIERNPLAVVASLANRDGFTTGFSSLLWLRHELEAERATRNYPRIFVSYEAMLGDWRAGIDEITNVLKIDWPTSAVEWHALLSTHFSADHQHFTASPDLLDADPRVADWVKEAYGALTDLGKSANDEVAMARLDAVRVAFDRASSIFGDASFPEMNVRIKAMSMVQAEAQALADQLSIENEKMGAEVERMRAKGVALEAKFSRDLGKALQESQRTMDRENAEAETRQAVVDKLRADIDARDHEIEQKNLIISDEKNKLLHAIETISEMKKSRSWKLMAPFRVAKTVGLSAERFVVGTGLRKMKSARYLLNRVIVVSRDDGIVSVLERTRKFVARRRDAKQYQKTDISGTVSSFHLTNEIGATNARRPLPERDIAIRIPLAWASKVVLPKNIAVVVHAFYVELFPEILASLENIEADFKLYVSTTDEEKKQIISSMCSSHGLSNVEIRIFENKGRDVAPKIVGFRDIYVKHDFFLHLHTKKSPHLSDLENWRSYLIGNLIGSKDVVRSIFSLFLSDKNVGIIYPQHFGPVRAMLNWGFDFEAAKTLLRRAKWDLSKDSVLEFPSGSMFWGRSAAIRPLLDLGLTFDEFPEEDGQVDGTLAHAIERSYLHFAECAGFHWLKIQSGIDSPSETLLTLKKPTDVKLLEKIYVPLFDEPGRSEFSLSRSYGELRPLRMTKSSNAKPRINLLLPTIDPVWVFGGISTALKIFEEIWSRLPDFDKRIVVLDSPVEKNHLASFPKYTLDPLGSRAVIFDAFDRALGLDVRRDDIFISTAWWSEYLRTSIASFQKMAFGHSSGAVYFIQDYESNFVQWSSRWAIAESTYNLAENVVALVNSEELSSFMNRRFGRTDQVVVPFRINETIEHKIRPVPKERIILCYGRPSAARNCFEIIVDGLSLWQQRNPTNASKWQVVFLGEAFEMAKVWPVQNSAVPGKVSLEEYAAYLSRASVGISLMISPHPSYPPLEMAHAGLITISNNYDTKNISARSPNLIGLDHVTPDTVAAALEKCALAAEENIGRVVKREEIREIPLVGSRYDPAELAGRLRSSL
ncbi:hypothetical protein FJ948_28705 [Mesorhizobium sp. B2-3-12]|nr:hypothetical protein FJ948_28705 [Mesorhizobium sp. B2-3-12]